MLSPVCYMRNPDKEFEEAFSRYSDELFRFALVKLSSREKALDLTQDAFLRSMEYARKGNDIRDVRAFLYRTLRHLIIDEYRKGKTVSLEAMLENDEGADQTLPDESVDALEDAMGRFDGAKVLEALKKLPEPYRETLTLRYNGELSVGEIAEVLEESENVISVRIHRGIRKLKDFFESQ